MQFSAVFMLSFLVISQLKLNNKCALLPNLLVVEY